MISFLLDLQEILIVILFNVNTNMFWAHWYTLFLGYLIDIIYVFYQIYIILQSLNTSYTLSSRTYITIFIWYSLNLHIYSIEFLKIITKFLTFEAIQVLQCNIWNSNRISFFEVICTNLCQIYLLTYPHDNNSSFSIPNLYYSSFDLKTLQIPCFNCKTY